MTVTLGAPKIPLVLPPADSHGGDLVIADIGIPLPVLDEVEGPYLELLTRERMRELVPARAADSHKGDFGRVLVDRRIARPHRRGAPGGDRRAAIGRRARHHRDAAIVRADHRRDGAGVHDRRPRRNARPARSTTRALDRVLDFKADVIAVGPGLGQAPGTVGVRARPARARRRAARPRRRRAQRVRRRAGAADGPRRRGRDHHAAPGRDGAAAEHLSIEAVQHDRLQHAREFAAAHKRPRRAQGAPHDHRRARRPHVRQPDRQRRAWRPAAPATC